MSTRTAIVVLAIGSALAVVPAAQTRRDSAAWLDAVTNHTPGQRDASVSRLSEWTRDDVDRVLASVSRFPPDERARVVSRALVLHADVAFFNRTTTGYDLPGGDGLILLFADGKEVGRMARTFHWDFGRRLIERLPRGEERTRIARVYYRAVGAVLQLWAEDGELQAHFNAAARALGSDPVLLMYEGTMYQADADPRSQRYFDQLRQSRRDQAATGLTSPLPTAVGSTMQPRTGVPVQPPTVERARADAERSFRRALAADPLLHEARVRLAHVLHDRGRHEEAARELAQAAAAPDLTASAFLEYYMAMLTGRVSRALDRPDAAQAAFERGLALQPGAQAPRLALSELAMARGDVSTAVRYLMPLGAGTGIDDPWWRLGRVHGSSSARALIDEMWGALR